MTEPADDAKPVLLPSTPSEIVRQCWRDLLELSYATRRVTRQEIEPGVQAIVIPAVCQTEADRELVAVDVRVAESHVPAMVRGVRLQLERLGDFGLVLPEDYCGWMGKWGRDLAAGITQVSVFVDLAYLEGALLTCFSEHGVRVEFSNPLAMFRRGMLSDYANVYETVSTMVAEGHSLADTAINLATELLGRLQAYAHAYHHLSSLYSQATWRIDGDNFMLGIPSSRISLALQYWQLRGDASSQERVLREWQGRIENFLRQATFTVDKEFPSSFAA